MGDFRRILFVHVEKMRHRRPYGLLRRIVGCHGDESTKHLEKSSVPEFDDIMMGRKPSIDKGPQVLTDRLAPMPVANAQIAMALDAKQSKPLPHVLSSISFQNATNQAGGAVLVNVCEVIGVSACVGLSERAVAGQRTTVPQRLWRNRRAIGDA